MTLKEALLQEQIPTAPLIRVLEGVFSPHSNEYRDVAHMRERDYVSFNTADRLLCRAGIPWPDVQDEELAGLYRRVTLQEDLPFREVNNGVRTCRAPGCQVKFTRKKARGAFYKQVYCSRGCRVRHYRQRTGVQAREHNRREYVCRNGHERTPESTEYLKNGQKRCKICNRERTQEHRQRRKLAAATATLALLQTPSWPCGEGSPMPNVVSVAEMPLGATGSG